MARAVLGLDVGGANVKAAHSDAVAVTRPFALWKQPQLLPQVLKELVKELPEFELLAVTLTAELADCFQTKAEGVAEVLAAVEQVANGRPVWVWQTGAEFVDVHVARSIPRLVAAANWHALATFVGRLAPQGRSLLLDVGTTTTDVIPLTDGVPVPLGLTDKDRLLNDELVYTGVKRTPVCAVVHSAPLAGQECPVAAELFATTADVYLWLEDLPEAPHQTDTADGRPATRAAAFDRLARMFCCDREELSPEDVSALARHVAEAQIEQIERAVRRVLQRSKEPLQAVLLSGSGTFLAERVVDRLPLELVGNAERIRLSECFSPAVSEAACAFALARLACERL